MALNRRGTFIALGTSITILYLVFFFWSSLAGTIGNDPAKYALNLTVPHPPLGRWLMALSQMIFGNNPTAARLPSLIADLASLWIFLKLILDKGGKTRLLAFLALVINAGSIYWMGQGYQASFMSCAIALLALGTGTKGPWRYYLASIGYMLAIWTQLQGLLLFPAVALLFWEGWRSHDLRLKPKDAYFNLFLILAVQSGLVCLWLMVHPMSIADAISLAGRAPVAAGRLQAFFLDVAFGRMILLASLSAALALAFSDNRKRLFPLTAAIVILSAYLFKNPASYYLPYVFALASWALYETELSARPAMTALLFASLVAFSFDNINSIRLLPYRSAQSGLNLTEAQAEISKNPDIMAIGTFGYEWNFLLGTRFRRFAHDASVQSATDNLILFLPQSLSDQEKIFISGFSKTELPGMALFRR